MKKLFALSLATLMSMTILTGCSSDDTAKDTTQDTSKQEIEQQTTSVLELEDIVNSGTINIGYTLYEPMNYEDENGELTGFDTEFTQAVCEKLGVQPNFIIINWDTKVVELESKNIDAIWNGMTITEELSANISISDPYVKNSQVIVINKANAEKYTDTESLSQATIVAEVGSAGEKAIFADESLSQATYIPLTKQTDTLLEIKAGTSDAAVFDWTLAKSVIGEGTDFEDLMMIEGVSLSEENYGIGFRKDSDLKEAVDTAMQELYEDGTLTALATKYGLGLSMEG